MVKRVVGFGSLFAFAVAVLGGCPIYGDTRGGPCSASADGTFYAGSCYCTSSYDCPNGTSCGKDGQCVGTGVIGPIGSSSCSQPSDCPASQNCGTDNKCHVGDCSNSGCPATYRCKLQNGTLQCVGTGTPDGSTFSGCRNDAACASLGAGAKCLNGACVAPADQCTDATQCPSMEQCVQGVCTPSCDAARPCPTGYSCDTNKGVCSGNPTPCGTTGASCTGGTTCVAQHCVTPCGAGNTCTGGLICIDGGCIPDQKPQFVCAADGPGTGMPGRDCAPGSTCLHHSCYIACNQDAGATACRAADRFNVCKSVTTSTGAYQVCGSASNLGTECDPTQGRACATPSAICIDGFCR